MSKKIYVGNLPLKGGDISIEEDGKKSDFKVSLFYPCGLPVFDGGTVIFDERSSLDFEVDLIEVRYKSKKGSGQATLVDADGACARAMGCMALAASVILVGETNMATVSGNLKTKSGETLGFNIGMPPT